MFKKKEIIPLPFPFYGLPVIILTLAGLADAAYLAISHYRNYTDIGYASFCAISRAINCDTVSQSPYAIFLNVPVAAWGVLGYAAVLLLAIHGWFQHSGARRGWNLLFVLSLLFSIYSVILAAISTYYIHSYCIMCILSYGINLLLLFYCWMIKKRFGLPPLWQGLKSDLSSLWKTPLSRTAMMLLVAAGLAGPGFYPAYWDFQSDLPSEELQTGITAEGHPWIGASQPELEIIEFADYLCFQCRKMHYYLRQLVHQNPDRVRLVHRHFPMDHAINPLVKEPFHVGSAQMAILAIYAAEEGRFWQMNDALFAHAAEKDELNLKELSASTGIALAGMQKALSARKDLEMLLAKDIWAGMKLNITGTPAYVIHDQVYTGAIPPEIIRKALP
jgi:uncharacterized membrane protein/predicted DsbA family dithiol-disulfide isomerase